MTSTTVENINSVEFIYCACGCQRTRPKYNINGVKMKYINGHARKGRKNTPEHNKIIGKANSGIRKIIVDYSVLHRRVRKRFPKPELCMLCNTKPVDELACITGIYNDELRNWAYFCHSCHMKWDNLGRRRRIKMKRYQKL